jgi:UDP-N-acetyl-D-mannosaminuronate dehydrogenase
MDALVIGMGEIGTAIQAIFQCEGIGRNNYPLKNHYDILHICFPFSKDFIKQVKEYQQTYSPIYTIIHSTVPLGVNRKLNSIASPCRGIHPNLEEGIRTFPKILAGEDAFLVADYFRKVGLKVILYDEPEAAEAAKLFDTEYYRHCIEFTLEVKLYCIKHSLNFSEVYTIPNETYNKGYTELGHPEYVRPVLQPIMTEIGGHCVSSNKVLISMSEEM